ncbi:MAG: NAD(P)H-hydrate dehydratase [Chloroflexota bacterium]|nr:NAD(P)H-hydrate dehydratase [Chloroflexota bacterium]MDE2961993.1 NAD(P)H-hydrate dehydratase [Chloroflexota bacterium]
MAVKVVTVAEMQALEAASEAAGVSTDTLMENAGLACARRVRECMGGAAGRRVLVLVGPGNNGADGLVLARHLARWGADVCCYIVRGRPDYDPKMTDALAYGVSVKDSAGDAGLSDLDGLLRRSDAVVDAILGAGRYRPLDGQVGDVATLVNCIRSHRHDLPVIAVDLPTGVNPDTGDADPRTINADETLALCHPKCGIANFPGAGYAGRITVLGIGLPDEVSASADADLPTEWMTPESARSLLPPRLLTAHKGTFGHLLIVAGSRNFVGAASLAARGAHRAGAGLVTLAAPESVYRLAASHLTETIHLPLPEDAEGRIDPSAADVIRQRIDNYSAVAVGCGLGWSSGATALMDRLLLTGEESPSMPIVIDADGLNNLAQCSRWADRLRAPAVLTPHPGEMATLTGQPTAQVQADRIGIASQSAADWRQTVLLKGAHSVVASPNGKRCVLPFANPALAAGGTGDVLTGIIGGLLAQGLAPYDAARLGGFLHGTAAEQVRAEYGNAGVVASDLLDRIPPIMANLRGLAVTRD